ncbi:MAG: type II toxin-antitoxin system PrlF family antitoxin [Chloroflexota bacterium]|nr:type II toxin-antitoxin system PrlF family antitoxin [Chloroflexota bacterium]
MAAEAEDRRITSGTATGGMLLVTEEGELRPKNQITVPRKVADALGVKPGDRLVFEIRSEEPHEVHVRRIRRDYAGALAGIYGSPDEVAAYLREERRAWGE